MKIGAVVPARYGSKRVPHKNIKMLGGRPLLCWTVDKLLEAGTFQNVCVSTESEEVAKVVRKYYAPSDVEVLMRPEELARDSASASQAFMHYFETHPDIEFGGTFLPTYPFRSVEKIQDIDAKLRSRYYWRVSSVSNEHYCTGEYYFPTKQGLKNIFTKHIISAPMNTSTYAYHHRCCPPGMWQRFYQTQNERTLTVNNDYHEDIDIDYPADFAFAEQIALGKKIRKVPLREHVFGDWCITVPEGVDVDKFIEYLGPEKLESMNHPLLVANRVQHAFASSLRLLEVYARQMFGCVEAYAYITKLDVADPSFNSQEMPEQYMASRYYRVQRLPDSYFAFSNKRESPPYDYHGIEFSGENIHTFSCDPVPTPRPGYQLAPDTLPWSRVIREEDLKQQDFYVDPIRLEAPCAGHDTAHNAVA